MLTFHFHPSSYENSSQVFGSFYVLYTMLGKKKLRSVNENQDSWPVVFLPFCIFKPTKKRMRTFSFAKLLTRNFKKNEEITKLKLISKSKCRHASNCNDNSLPGIFNSNCKANQSLDLILCACSSPKSDDIINKFFPSHSCGHVRNLLHHLESGLYNLGKEHHHHDL